MKPQRGHPLLVRFVLLICLPLAAALLAGLLYLRGSLPAPAGELIVSGLHAPVTIRRDSHGVAQIQARSDNDAYFALGYLHAQDRLWQLEMQRRLAQGRLSEVLGRRTLEQDIWMRTLNLYGAAASSWQALSAAARASLEAYANGINAYLKEGRTLPPEFLLLGVTPQPWRPMDSLAWFKVFGLGQSNAMRQEANRYVLRRYLQQAQWSALEREYPADAPVTADPLPALAGIARMSLKLQQTLAVGGSNVGSNAWVIAGALTEEGAPILANDPHMNLQMPSLWYVASLSAPGFYASGMSIVGLPNIVFGRNAHIAWGGTNMMADTQDLYLLQADPEHPNRHLVNGHWQALEVHQELIAVRSDFPAALRQPREPVRVQVRRSHLGPVISDALGLMDQPVSLHWPALEEHDTSYETLFRLAYARDWQQFNHAVAYLVAPAINLVYADTANNIGYVGGGRIPIRKRGEGSLPVSAADPGHQWQGYIPFDEMPRVFNPVQGYLVTANNKVVSEQYPYFISRDWAPPARALRVVQMLDETLQRRGRIGFADVLQMQADVKDLEAVELKEYLLSLLAQQAAPSEPLQLLKHWDGRMAREQVPAAIFNMWLVRLRERLLRDDLKPYENNSAQGEVLRGYTQGVSALQIKHMMGNPSYDWCDDRSTALTESCAQIAQSALEEALAELDKRQGRQSRWRWERIHHAVFAHLPFSNVNLLDRLFERRIESPGSENSVAVAAGRYSEAEGFEQQFGAVFRQVISLAPGAARHAYMNSTGQSGNPLSKHYDEMLEPFNRVEFFELPAAPAQAAPDEPALTLMPGSLASGGGG